MSIGPDLSDATKIKVIPTNEGNITVKAFDVLDRGDHIMATHQCRGEIRGLPCGNMMHFAYYNDERGALLCPACGFRIVFWIAGGRLPWRWADFLRSLRYDNRVLPKEIAQMIESALADSESR